LLDSQVIFGGQVDLFSGSSKCAIAGASVRAINKRLRKRIVLTGLLPLSPRSIYFRTLVCDQGSIDAFANPGQQAPSVVCRSADHYHSYARDSLLTRVAARFSTPP